MNEGEPGTSDLQTQFTAYVHKERQCWYPWQPHEGAGADRRADVCRAHGDETEARVMRKRHIPLQFQQGLEYSTRLFEITYWC